MSLEKFISKWAAKQADQIALATFGMKYVDLGDSYKARITARIERECKAS